MSPAKRKGLTPPQREKAEYIVVMCEGFAEQIRKMLAMYGLDGVRGAGVSINVYAEEVLDVCSVIYGDEMSEAGMIYRLKEAGSNAWETVNPSARRYEGVSGKAEIGHGMPEGNPGEKPVPPDGLWLSRFDDDHPLDCGV